MLFNSDVFLLLFLPLTYIVFLFLVSLNNRRGVVVWLVAASLFFYGWWNYSYLLLLIVSIVVNFTIGTAMVQRFNGIGRRKLLLTAGVIFNLSLIAYFKYAGFIVFNIGMLTGNAYQIEEIILPLAISFFTFQQIAYLADQYSHERRVYKFLDYALYVSFFPQLIAGPIVYPRNIMPQIMERGFKGRHSANLAVGLTLFFVGLFKKVIIADSLAEIATPVFYQAETGDQLAILQAWQGALAYTFQLYFDFSGYSDMAIGLGRMFGLRLPLNFNSPYKAENIVDFWRRWHMTLSRFLRDYLYIPLGGNRRGRARRYINLLTTMFLGGLWHGAAWTFALWGMMHGLFLIINLGWRAIIDTLGYGNIRTSLFYRLSAWGLTFLSVVMAWVLFRAESFDGAGHILLAMVGLSETIETSSQSIDWFCLFGAAVLALFMPNSQEWMGLNKRGSIKMTAWRKLVYWRPTPIFSVGIATIAFTSFYFLRGTSKFLYFEF